MLDTLDKKYLTGWWWWEVEAAGAGSERREDREKKKAGGEEVKVSMLHLRSFKRGSGIKEETIELFYRNCPNTIPGF